jgi:predicted component of type VI protein secretion system
VDIVRNADGTLLVPIEPERRHTDDDADPPRGEDQADADPVEVTPTTRLIHPGEGGYDEALAAWDLEQNPDRAPVVSTASGRQEAMTLVHAVAISPDHAVAPAVEALDDPEASGEALRHVLVGGVHSVEDFSAEVAEAEGGEVLPAHQTTKIIGEVLKELDD